MDVFGACSDPRLFSTPAVRYSQVVFAVTVCFVVHVSSVKNPVEKLQI